MNQLAVETLIRAGLSGHKQVRHKFHTRDGDCALGVLHLALHSSRRDAISCLSQAGRSCDRDDSMVKVFGLTQWDEEEVIALNDKGLDFIGIARKMEDYRPHENGKNL